MHRIWISRLSYEDCASKMGMENSWGIANKALQLLEIYKGVSVGNGGYVWPLFEFRSSYSQLRLKWSTWNRKDILKTRRRTPPCLSL